MNQQKTVPLFSSLFAPLRLCVIAFFCTLSLSALEVTDVTTRQRWPWNNYVDIDFVLNTNGTEDASVFAIDITGTYAGGTKTVAASTFVTAPDAMAGTNRVTWNLVADYPDLRTTDLTLTVTASEVGASDLVYLVIDLSDGSTAASYPVRYTTQAPDLSNDTCRTDELWLRRIPAGTFTMGSPGGEVGRDGATEDLHKVTLTKGLYIGVFEVTQSQWTQVMGTWTFDWSNPLYWSTRPAEEVSYFDIRGTSSGTNWPNSSGVDVDSFVGKLRSRTGISTLDLPTDAQWEYACRAGTTKALAVFLPDGLNLTNETSDANMNLAGRYKYNGGQVSNDGGVSWTVPSPYSSVTDSNATAKVGSYLPNAWGLYDMHGNVLEWCLDRYISHLGTADVIDPAGETTGDNRVVRSGTWASDAKISRSARRGFATPTITQFHVGLRLANPMP